MKKYKVAAAAKLRRTNRTLEASAPVFDDRADFGVIKDQIGKDEQHAKRRVEAETNQECRPLDGLIERERPIHIVEQRRMDICEQHVIDEKARHGEPQEPAEVDAAGSEELVGARGPASCIAVDDASRQEHPDQQIASAQEQNGCGPRTAIQERAQIAERHCEADDRGPEHRRQRPPL